MVSLLTNIVDATNRPAFYGYGGYDVPPLTLGLSSYFGFSTLSPPSGGWHVPTLWGWGSPMSHFGEGWYYPDLIGAGLSLRNYGDIYDSNPERFPYVWNNLMWRNYYPYGLPFSWAPPLPYSPWPAPQNYGGQAPASAPSAAPPASVHSGNHASVDERNSGDTEVDTGHSGSSHATGDGGGGPSSGISQNRSGRSNKRGRTGERSSGGDNLSWSEFQANPSIQRQIKSQLGEGSFTNARGMVLFTRTADNKTFYFPKQGNGISAVEIDF